MESLTAHFDKADAVISRDRLDRHYDRVRENSRKNVQESIKTDDDVVALVTQVMATEAQLAKFGAQLEIYEEATVKALMKNQEQLDAVNARLDGQMERAHRLADGTIVSETRDGTQVFDVDGRRLDVSPDELGFRGNEPKWEDVRTDMRLRNTLEAERGSILEFQERTDAARERLEEGGLSEDELSDLEKDLEDNMPDAVAEFVPGLERQPQPTLKSEFVEPAGSPFHPDLSSQLDDQIPQGPDLTLGG